MEVLAGQLNTLVTLISGWETITNPLDAVPGRASEPDSDFRRRYQLSTGRLANGPMDALEAAILETGATAIRVEENSTIAQVTLQGFDLPAHSVTCIVRGGTDADVAAAIARAKSMGVVTYGGAGAGAVTIDGINFRRTTETRVLITVELTSGPMFPANGIALVKQYLLEYVLGVWSGGVGQFDTAGFQIGEPVNANRLQVPVNAVPGHMLTSMTVTDASSNALPATPNLDILYTLAAADITVTVTVS